MALEELGKLLKGASLGITDKKTPDMPWILGLISTVEVEHQFFKKDYMPNVYLGEEIDNDDGF